MTEFPTPPQRETHEAPKPAQRRGGRALTRIAALAAGGAALAVLAGGDSAQPSALDQLRSQLTGVTAGPFDIDHYEQYGNGWGIIQITSPDTDDANVIVQSTNGGLEVKQGPGTSFDKSDLQAVNAPDDVIKNANKIEK